ncbi:MAG: Xaa-Pro aminopeptidase [Pseudomonadales bacterium]|nr:Xaa-Pro aminopeptidase [Pseudomonadales bacterium]
MNMSEFVKRRAKLMEHMGQGSIAVVPAARVVIRSKDTEYPFRQNSDFYYLTGFVEANAVLVLVPGREKGESILFCEERLLEVEQWTGERMGPDRGVQMLGVDDAFPYSDLTDILPGLLEGQARIHVTLGEQPTFDKELLALISELQSRSVQGIVAPGEIVALSHLLHDLRLYKSSHELQLMRKAASITCRAHERAMLFCQAGFNESDLEAELLHEFMRGGARFPAYPCIVGSGANACVMHYTGNADVMNTGDLVLIDAGCEYEHYASDVTRTFPVSGRFTDAQKQLYNIVLAAQLAAIDAVHPGNAFDLPHTRAIRVMAEGLVELGLLVGDVDHLIESEQYKTFCVHKTSHWMGLDVHDVGDYRVGEVWRELEPGMVLTIEPGLYVPDSAEYDLPWRGMGIRIEDDVLVTRQGHEVLTHQVVKTVEDIELLMSGQG